MIISGQGEETQSKIIVPFLGWQVQGCCGDV